MRDDGAGTDAGGREEKKEGERRATEEPWPVAFAGHDSPPEFQAGGVPLRSRRRLLSSASSHLPSKNGNNLRPLPPTITINHGRSKSLGGAARLLEDGPFTGHVRGGGQQAVLVDSEALGQVADQNRRTLWTKRQSPTACSFVVDQNGLALQFYTANAITFYPDGNALNLRPRSATLDDGSPGACTGNAGFLPEPDLTREQMVREMDRTPTYGLVWIQYGSRRCVRVRRLPSSILNRLSNLT